MAYESWVAFMASPWFYLILIWSAVWKGISLWKSAGKRHLVWFIFLFITNTVGILPIIYLLIHGKKKKRRKK